MSLRCQCEPRLHINKKGGRWRVKKGKEMNVGFFLPPACPSPVSAALSLDFGDSAMSSPSLSLVAPARMQMRRCFSSQIYCCPPSCMSGNTARCTLRTRPELAFFSPPPFLHPLSYGDTFFPLLPHTSFLLYFFFFSLATSECSGEGGYFGNYAPPFDCYCYRGRFGLQLNFPFSFSSAFLFSPLLFLLNSLIICPSGPHTTLDEHVYDIPFVLFFLFFLISTFFCMFYMIGMYPYDYIRHTRTLRLGGASRGGRLPEYVLGSSLRLTSRSWPVIEA